MKEDWDRSLQVGDLVTGYHVGVWKITKIEQRYVTQDLLYPAKYAGIRWSRENGYTLGEEIMPQIHYTRVLSPEFEPSIKKNADCEARYCTKIDNNYLIQMREETERKIMALSMALRKLLPTTYGF